MNYKYVSAERHKIRKSSKQNQELPLFRLRGRLVRNDTA